MEGRNTPLSVGVSRRRGQSHTWPTIDPPPPSSASVCLCVCGCMWKEPQHTIDCFLACLIRSRWSICLSWSHTPIGHTPYYYSYYSILDLHCRPQQQSIVIIVAVIHVGMETPSRYRRRGRRQPTVDVGSRLYYKQQQQRSDDNSGRIGTGEYLSLAMDGCCDWTERARTRD